MKKVPVFLIQGFLDSGKTSFINATIKRDKLFSKGKTLLLCCEQGEREYSVEELKKFNIEVVYFNNEDEFSILKLNELNKMYNPARYIIEMNFLWDENKIVYPEFMDIMQIFTIIDGQTFPFYYPNMKQKFTNAIQVSDVVAFTKMNGDSSSLNQFKQSLAITNYRCFYCIMNDECLAEKEAFDSLVPYDLTSNELKIENNDFGIFYIDSYTNKELYENKIVELSAWVVKSDKLKDNEFILGRKVLNCCANDIQFFGFLVNDDLKMHLKHNDWIHIKARCNVVYSEEYKEDEIVLTPIDIKKISPIIPDILDLR